jgi:hypothetical protein
VGAGGGGGGGKKGPTDGKKGGYVSNKAPYQGKVELKAGDTSWQGGKSKKGVVEGKVRRK